MKITTWNVNGIRAVLKKGFWDGILGISPDVLCLQEVKARPEQVPDGHRDQDGYVCFWNAAERPGYSGVATYSRFNPLDIGYGLGVEKFDREGRVIRLRFPDFFLYNVYFPSGQRGQDRVGFKLEFYECLLHETDRLIASGENVIITGDFNTAHQEIDLANPRANIKTSGFMPEERAWVDTYIQHGFVDAFRHLFPEQVAYTWWTYRAGARERNVGWRLDYYLVSQSLIDRVVDVTVHSEVSGSDHCPVSLTIN